jgi:hypothetical protein
VARLYAQSPGPGSGFGYSNKICNPSGARAKITPSTEISKVMPDPTDSPSQFPFEFEPGQRVKCPAGKTGTVVERWNTHRDAVYVVEFDGSGGRKELLQSELRPSMMITRWCGESVSPFDFELNQRVRCVTGATGQIVKRWLTTSGARYLISPDRPGAAVQAYESEIADAGKIPWPWDKLTS